FAAHVTYACTTFCFMQDNAWIYGRNYDWYTEHCLIVVNKRGVTKTALTQDNPTKWESKYGSITFNQYGREFPLGGMNQAGLIIELMWLDQTEYPEPDQRQAVSALQWVQYQLDNCSTVEEVVASNRTLRILSRATPLHFLACDRNGNAAAIEFLDGQMVVHRGRDLPQSALTNSTYASSIRMYEDFVNDETKESFLVADYSLKRFVWAARGVEEWNPESNESSIDYAFEILDKVSVPATMFRIVYDPGNNRIYYFNRSNPHVRSIDCSAFEYSCETPVKVLDINAGQPGDVTVMFTDYTYEMNYDLIDRVYSETDFLKAVPDSVRAVRARYPETLSCE
ncbi:linear amide C-N hydrolase, partial [candidate division WOR-3 bacterium]|nr:linear amide C-N hydrolase [candidate division WOR-3 bacterium]